MNAEGFPTRARYRLLEVDKSAVEIALAREQFPPEMRLISNTNNKAFMIALLFLDECGQCVMSAAEQTENKCSQIATFVIRATSDLFPADGPLITCRDHKICSTPKNLTTL